MASKRKKAAGFKNILYATDFSDVSLDAFETAINMAKKYNAKLTVVHIVDTTPQASGFYLPHITLDNMDKDMKLAAEEMLRKKFSKRLSVLKGHSLVAVLGVPYKEIIKLSTKNKSDLVVIGTYGRSGVDRLVFGSTTERVLRNSKCPVLAVPPS